MTTTEPEPDNVEEDDRPVATVSFTEAPPDDTTTESMSEPVMSAVTIGFAADNVVHLRWKEGRWHWRKDVDGPVGLRVLEGVAATRDLALEAGRVAQQGGS